MRWDGVESNAERAMVWDVTCMLTVIMDTMVGSGTLECLLETLAFGPYCLQWLWDYITHGPGLRGPG